MPARWICLLPFFVYALAGAIAGLVRVSDPWRFMVSSNLPASPVAWNQLEFNDSQWNVGPSGFSAGFFAYGEATSLPPLTDGAALLLRRRFVVDSLGAATWLALRIDY